MLPTEEFVHAVIMLALCIRISEHNLYERRAYVLEIKPGGLI
jgi:hypothetical protein